MTTDKTGAPTTVTKRDDEFTIAVDGHTVGLTAFADRDNQRIFIHTEVDNDFEGRGLATILIDEAVRATKDEGLRVVAVCPMVARFLDKHREFQDIRDPVTRDVDTWLKSS